MRSLSDAVINDLTNKGLQIFDAFPQHIMIHKSQFQFLFFSKLYKIDLVIEREHLWPDVMLPKNIVSLGSKGVIS